MRSCRLFIISVSLLLSICTFAAEKEGDWGAILKGDHRSKQHVDRNEYRHPKQTLQFFGVNSASVVVEIWPGGSAWYTEVLAPLLKAEGLLYAAHFPADASVPFFRSSRKAFDEKLRARPDVYGSVLTTVLMPPNQLDIAPQGTADYVLTFRNVHNWMKSGTEDVVFAAMYKALKPGGVLGVVEHRAKPGLPLQQMIDTGYVTESAVVEMAESAGFVLAAKSDVNANPRDSTEHPKGVWTLPPSLRLGDEKREKYLAIGESDRMTLKFIKPLK